jgi:hypothetical protein
MKYALLIIVALFACNSDYKVSKTKTCKIIKQEKFLDWSLAIHSETKWRVITECGDTVVTTKKSESDSITFVWIVNSDTL